jgi:hypothetical protein
VFTLMVPHECMGSWGILKEAQDLRCLGTAVEDIANRDDLVPARKARFVEQHLEFKIATVDVTDDQGVDHRFLDDILSGCPPKRVGMEVLAAFRVRNISTKESGLTNKIIEQSDIS